MAEKKKSVPRVIATCGCGARTGKRKALGVDSEIKSSNLKRLRRIEGQVRGLQRLVDEDRYCADILVQISSVQEALRSVSRALMRNHLRHCASEAIRDTSPGRAEAMYEELLNLMDRHSRWGSYGQPDEYAERARRTGCKRPCLRDDGGS